MISLNIHSFVFICLCVKTCNPAAAGDQGRRSARLHRDYRLILLLCTDTAVPVRPQNKALLNCLNADFLSTMTWQQLWAKGIHSLTRCESWRRKEGCRKAESCLGPLIFLNEEGMRQCWMRLRCGAVGEATKFRLLLGFSLARLLCAADGNWVHVSCSLF